MNEERLGVRGRVEHCLIAECADRDARFSLLASSLGNIQVSRFRSLAGTR
jgi:hypothetical protein